MSWDIDPSEYRTDRKPDLGDLKLLKQGLDLADTFDGTILRSFSRGKTIWTAKTYRHRRDGGAGGTHIVETKAGSLNELLIAMAKEHNENMYREWDK